jgi:3-hydroxybutyryl-CoA dehydrogenase
VGAGELGRKTGKGFYIYDNGKKIGENVSALNGLGPGNLLTAKDIWSHLAGAIIQEAERLVSEGNAGKSDIDTAIKLAMNFPKGPFEWQKENTAA